MSKFVAEGTLAGGAGKTIREFPDFLTVLSGQTVSVIGSQITAFALSVWFYQHTRSVLQFGAVIAVQLLPGILFAPFAGILVDRFHAKRVMVCCAFGLAVGSAVLYALARAQLLTPVTILFFSPALAVFASAHQIAYAASIPTLVPKKLYGRANGYVQLGINGSAAVVPFISVYALEALGLATILLLNIITYSVGAVTLWLARFIDNRPPRSERRTGLKLKGLLAHQTVGVRDLLGQRNLLVLILFLCAISFLNGLVLVLFRPIILSTQSATVLGWLVTIAGIGGLIGAVFSGRFAAAADKVRTLLAASVVSGLGMFFCGLAFNHYFLAVLVFAFSFSAPIILVTAQTLIQMNTAADTQGRMFASRAFFAGVALILAVVGSPLVTAMIIEPWLGAGGLFGSALAGFVGAGETGAMRAIFVFAGALMVLSAMVARYSKKLATLRSSADIPIAPSIPVSA